MRGPERQGVASGHLEPVAEQCVRILPHQTPPTPNSSPISVARVVALLAGHVYTFEFIFFLNVLLNKIFENIHQITSHYSA